MFGYVLPSRDRLDERERERFRAVYCGLCHTLRERYGFAASLLLNYDFTLLAILLSSGDEESCTVRRCAVHPCKGCRAQTSTPALEAAADRTVILSWWQLRDHIADHGFWSGLKYRFASLFLRGAYRRAGERLPHFDAAVRLHLQALAAFNNRGYRPQGYQTVSTSCGNDVCSNWCLAALCCNLLGGGGYFCLPCMF